MNIYQAQLSSKKINMLIMGEAGSGKTTLAGSSTAVPEMCDVLYLNIEGGNLSLIDAESVGIPKPPDMLDLTAWEETEEIVTHLAFDKHPYKTLIVDSLSELSKLNVDFIVGKKVREVAKYQDREIDEVYLEDWGKNAQLMRRFVRALRDLPLHVIFITHTRQLKLGTQEVVAPSLGPELAKSVVSMMDVVGFLKRTEKEVIDGEKKVKIPEWKLLVKPVASYMTKDRSPGEKLGGTITNPNMMTIYNRLMGR